MTGYYIFKSYSNVDAYGYFYTNSFNPSDTTINLLAEDDESGGYGQFLIRYWLQSSQTYVLVFTTYVPRITAAFSIIATGSSNVDFGPVIPPSSSIS
ncbi:unnamed protein product, partial [Rotaria sp. Silwood2]